MRIIIRPECLKYINGQLKVFKCRHMHCPQWRTVALSIVLLVASLTMEPKYARSKVVRCRPYNSEKEEFDNESS